MLLRIMSLLAFSLLPEIIAFSRSIQVIRPNFQTLLPLMSQEIKSNSASWNDEHSMFHTKKIVHKFSVEAPYAAPLITAPKYYNKRFGRSYVFREVFAYKAGENKIEERTLHEFDDLKKSEMLFEWNQIAKQVYGQLGLDFKLEMTCKPDSTPKSIERVTCHFGYTYSIISKIEGQEPKHIDYLTLWQVRTYNIGRFTKRFLDFPGKRATGLQIRLSELNKKRVINLLRRNIPNAKKLNDEIRSTEWGQNQAPYTNRIEMRGWEWPTWERSWNLPAAESHVELNHDFGRYRVHLGSSSQLSVKGDSFTYNLVNLSEFY